MVLTHVVQSLSQISDVLNDLNSPTPGYIREVHPVLTGHRQ